MFGSFHSLDSTDYENGVTEPWQVSASLLIPPLRTAQYSPLRPSSPPPPFTPLPQSETASSSPSCLPNPPLQSSSSSVHGIAPSDTDTVQSTVPSKTHFLRRSKAGYLSGRKKKPKVITLLPPDSTEHIQDSALEAQESSTVVEGRSQSPRQIGERGQLSSHLQTEAPSEILLARSGSVVTSRISGVPSLPPPPYELEQTMG